MLSSTSLSASNSSVQRLPPDCKWRGTGGRCPRLVLCRHAPRLGVVACEIVSPPATRPSYPSRLVRGDAPVSPEWLNADTEAGEPVVPRDSDMPRVLMNVPTPA